ncbi:MAG: hypothetical protein Q7V05_00030 [Methanoregula sp.]|nr:hypothetical protein [Methanoregula sp.]
MPIDTEDLLKSVGLFEFEKVLWGKKMCEKLPPKNGIYIILYVRNYHTYPTAPFNNNAINCWIKEVKSLRLNGFSPSNELLTLFLRKYWLPDEKILYIGRASGKNTLKKRLRAFYNHKLGESRPHRGGHWLKTLDLLDELCVYWAETEDAKEKEELLLIQFSKLNQNTIPFANLVNGDNKRKQHELKGSVNRK